MHLQHSLSYLLHEGENECTELLKVQLFDGGERQTLKSDCIQGNILGEFKVFNERHLGSIWAGD
jgi:hypothetical protein